MRPWWITHPRPSQGMPTMAAAAAAPHARWSAEPSGPARVPAFFRLRQCNRGGNDTPPARFGYNVLLHRN